MSDKTYPVLKLKNGKEESLLRRHPWVFSGAIQGDLSKLADGEKVMLAGAKGQVLASGHFAAGSIAVRVLAFAERYIDTGFYIEKLQNALNLRRQLGLYGSTTTDAYRLVHGEGDGLPGLVVDIYNKVAVAQAHSAGMSRDMPQISEALKALFGNGLDHIIARSAVKGANALLPEGQPEETTIVENGHHFKANWATGQKTGFFLDQRDNRQLLAQYAKNRKLLNAFCYSGGFSIYALQAGVRDVHSLDSSAKALELLEEHLAMNSLGNAAHRSIKADALDYLSSADAKSENYDLIVLDPPAFAKHRSARHAAIQAYRRINAKAFEMIEPGGILFTFSCSQVVTPQLFNHAVAAAAIDSRREVRILHHLHQPADHPVSIFHPEGEYLKGLVLEVV